MATKSSSVPNVLVLSEPRCYGAQGTPFPRTVETTVAEELDPNFAPYAPYKQVQAAITRYRERGLPDPLTSAELERIGVPPGMAPRTLRALRFLGLVDEGGNRMPTFEELKRAKTDEYPTRLAELVRGAYLPVFQIVDPAKDSDTALDDAFRHYEPSAQRTKMIALFRGLAEEAEIIEKGKPRQRDGGSRRIEPTPPKRRPAGIKKAEPEPTVTLTFTADETPDYRLIQAVIQQLPREPRWTTTRRTRWIAALTAAVDLVFEVQDEPTAGQ